MYTFTNEGSVPKLLDDHHRVWRHSDLLVRSLVPFNDVGCHRLVDDDDYLEPARTGARVTNHNLGSIRLQIYVRQRREASVQ